MFYVAMIVLGTFDMILCLNRPDYVLNRYPMYPVFGIILLGECVFFMGGITRTEAGLVGDVAPEVLDVAGHVAPMPGGVGPMTRAMLLSNVVDRAESLAQSAAGVARS